MNRSLQVLAFAVLLPILAVGCSSSEPQNITANASQEEIDNYNKLIEAAENEMKGDGEVEELKDE